MSSSPDLGKVAVIWLGLGVLLWFVSLYVPAPPSGFLLTPEKLKENLAKSGDTLVSALVAHRGFHYSNDDMKRPLENTVPAYERAWSAGVIYAECDVTATKDGEIVLSHDPNLKRLALHPESASKPINSLDFGKELVNIPLKDGSRVPKLIEVLQSARRISSKSRLVVEIKDSSVETARKVAGVVATELGQHVGLVMSFKLSAIAEFAKINPRKKAVPSMLLAVKSDSGDGSFVFDLGRVSAIEDIVRKDHLDGVYLEYDPLFLTDLRFPALCRKIRVGIWGMPRESSSAALLLIQKGAEYVNTDLNDDFFHA